MHLRPLVLTTAFVTSALVGCTRDELAPWGFAEDVRLQCESPAAGQVGVTYSWTPTVQTGRPVTYELGEGIMLPAGLTLNPMTGEISGTPTEDGSFPLTLVVTDNRDIEFTIACGPIVIDPGAGIQCGDGMGGDIPDAFVDFPYTLEVTVSGGTPPYASWTDNNTLPPGLTLMQDGSASDKAVITGAPTQDGTFNVNLEVTDANGQVITATCGELIVRNPITVDPEKLLEVFPDGCVGHGVTLSQLIKEGVVIPIDGAADPTCQLENGRGNGSRNFDGDSMTPDTFPPGINVSSDCELTGTIDSKLRYGVYAWITTLVQAAPTVSIPSESKGWLPYCAPQSVKPGTAYPVVREDGNPPDDKTFAPGVAWLDTNVMPYQFSYGTDVPDPKVTVTYNEDCAGACYYAYIFSFNALSSGAVVNAGPSSKFPDMGFDGFTHAIRVSENDQSFLGGRARPRRAFVTNISFDYCIAQNDADCGNNLGNTDAEKALKADLIRKNGGGSGYEFGLVVLPQN